MRSRVPVVLILAACTFYLPAHAQDVRSAELLGSSPFPAPEASDSLFVIDTHPFLDTPCLFRGDGPMVIEFDVTRVVGPTNKTIQELVAGGVIASQAELILPAFDVDFNGTGPGVNPERDRISFNGRVLDPPFLMGDDGIWRLNSFRVNVADVMFPSDPGLNGTVVPAENVVRVDIDTANGSEEWCTAIDWIALKIEVVRPIAFFHGILSNQGIWDGLWVPTLEARGFLTDRRNLGALDSIQNNAAKIATVVNRMRDRLGVDKVNIVAHSKGGLDSRHYVENRDTVERVVQLGTPNLGSPLADYIQAGSVILIGVGNTVLLDLALPAGFQLTTSHMVTYNAFHGLNSEIAYTSLAGDYDDAPFFSIYYWLDVILPSPNDGIVPVASAHALAMRNLTYSSRDNDMSATHRQIHSAQGAFSRVENQVTAFGSPLRLGPGPLLAERTSSQGDMLAEGESVSFPVQLDGDGRAAFTVMYGMGDLDLAVITPDGVRIDSDAAPGLPGFHHDAEEASDGLKAEVVTVEDAQAGIYTAEISAVSVVNPGGEEPFLLTAWLPDTDLSLSATSPDPSIGPSEDLVIEALLEQGGIGVVGATIVATAVSEDESPLTIALSDDGGGSYSGVFSAPLLAGSYRVRVVAGGTNLVGASFTREAFVAATVTASSISITPPHAESATDTNGNGLFDLLEVAVGVTADTAAEVLLFGELTDAGGTTTIATAQATAQLNPGLQEVMLAFDGQRIFASRQNGPYLLRVVRVAELEAASRNLLPADEATDILTTATYQFQQFEHDLVILTGVSELVGIDLDSNGLFDQAQATIEIEVIQGGPNEWTGRLLAPSGEEVAFASAGGALPAGISTIQLVFDGCRLVASGEDGDFRVEEFLFFGDSGSLVESSAVATGQLDASDFECDLTTTSDLGVFGSIAPDPVGVGEQVEVNLTVTNDGPSQATNVVSTTFFSGPAAVSSAFSPDGVCGAIEDLVTCSFSTLDSGDTATVVIFVGTSESGVLTSDTTIVGSEVDLSPANNSLQLAVLIGGIVDIPTLGSIGLVALVLLLCGLAVFRIRRRFSS